MDRGKESGTRARIFLLALFSIFGHVGGDGKELFRVEKERKDDMRCPRHAVPLAAVSRDVLEERNILFLQDGAGKTETLERMIDVLARHPGIGDADALQKGIFLP